MKKQLSFTKDKEADKEPELRATGRRSSGNKLTQLYIGAVDRSRSSSRASPQVKPKRSFNRSGFKVDKDEIKKGYHDVRSDNTGMYLSFHFPYHTLLITPLFKTLSI